MNSTVAPYLLSVYCKSYTLSYYIFYAITTDYFQKPPSSHYIPIHFHMVQKSTLRDLKCPFNVIIMPAFIFIKYKLILVKIM